MGSTGQRAGGGAVAQSCGGGHYQNGEQPVCSCTYFFVCFLLKKYFQLITVIDWMANARNVFLTSVLLILVMIFRPTYSCCLPVNQTVCATLKLLNLMGKKLFLFFLVPIQAKLPQILISTCLLCSFNLQRNQLEGSPVLA